MRKLKIGDSFQVKPMSEIKKWPNMGGDYRWAPGQYIWNCKMDEYAGMTLKASAISDEGYPIYDGFTFSPSMIVDEGEEDDYTIGCLDAKSEEQYDTKRLLDRDRLDGYVQAMLGNPNFSYAEKPEAYVRNAALIMIAVDNFLLNKNKTNE